MASGSFGKASGAAQSGAFYMNESSSRIDWRLVALDYFGSLALGRMLTSLSSSHLHGCPDACLKHQLSQLLQYAVQEGSGQMLMELASSLAFGTRAEPNHSH